MFKVLGDINFDYCQQYYQDCDDCCITVNTTLTCKHNQPYNRLNIIILSVALGSYPSNSMAADLHDSE